MELYVSNKYLIELPSDIYNTSAYAKLKRYIETEKEIKEDDVLWSELENVVLESSPNFKRNLKLLLEGKLSFYDLHTALLIKCGMTPEQMSILFNRTKGAISSRRGDMCRRMLDEKLGNKVVDGIICLL